MNKKHFDKCMVDAFYGLLDDYCECVGVYEAIEFLHDRGFTRAELIDALGFSEGAVKEALGPEEDE